MLRDEKNKDLRWHIALEITNGRFSMICGIVFGVTVLVLIVLASNGVHL